MNRMRVGWAAGVLGGLVLALWVLQAAVLWQKWSGWDGTGPVPPAQDLMQHAAAGRTWREAGWEGVYGAGGMREAMEALAPGNFYGGEISGGGYLYPPAAAWVASWGAGWSLEQWRLAWTAAGLLGYAAAVGLVVPWMGRGGRWMAAVAAFMFPGWLFMVDYGQNGWVTLLVLAVAARLGGGWAGAWVLGMLIFKPLLLAGMLPWVALLGAPRLAVRAGWAAVVYAAVGCLVFGWEAHAAWWRTAAGQGHTVGTWLLGVNVQSVVWSRVPEWAGASVGVWAGLLAGAAVWRWGWKKAVPWEGTGVAVLLAPLPCLLVLPYALHYDLVAALPGVVWVAARIEQRRRGAGWAMLFAFCLAASLATLPLTTGWNHTPVLLAGWAGLAMVLLPWSGKPDRAFQEEVRTMLAGAFCRGRSTPPR